MPIVQIATFTYKNAKEIELYTKKGRKRFKYGRYGNPTEQIAEKRQANFEGVKDVNDIIADIKQELRKIRK